MQLVKQYKLSTYVAQNMSARAERILSTAKTLNQYIGQGQTPMEEDEAKGLLSVLMDMTKNIQACFSDLFEEIKECAKVFEPETVVVELAPPPEPAKLITLKEYLKDKPFTPKQVSDRMALLRKQGQNISPAGKIPGKGTEKLWELSDLQRVVEGWNPGPLLGRPHLKAKNTSFGQDSMYTLGSCSAIEAPKKMDMVSLSDFVDQYELDPWRANRLRGFLQQAYYDKAITLREEKSYGPNRFYAYPVAQLEVAATRWAHQFLGNKGLLKKKS